MEFLSRFVPHIPIYDCYRRKLVGEELVRESAPRLAEGEEGRSFEPKTGIPGGGSMEGMHRRSRWHGSPTGVGSRWTIVERNRDSCSDAENSGLVRTVLRRIVAVERSASPRSSCVITFRATRTRDPRNEILLLFSRFSRILRRINIELSSRSISSSTR